MLTCLVCAMESLASKAQVSGKTNMASSRSCRRTAEWSSKESFLFYRLFLLVSSSTLERLAQIIGIPGKTTALAYPRMLALQSLDLGNGRFSTTMALNGLCSHFPVFLRGSASFLLAVRSFPCFLRLPNFSDILLKMVNF